MVQRSRQRAVDRAWKSYIADSLHAMSQGKSLRDRYDDIIRPREEIDVDAIIERVERAIGE